MSLVHSGGDAWDAVAVREAGTEALPRDAEDVVVDRTEAPGEPVEREEAGDVLGVADALCVPDPEVALVHPASAPPATSAKTVSCELQRIIASAFLGIQMTSFTSSCR